MEFIGGQAVIEGVLIKGPKKLAIAVRNPQGEIVTKEEESISVTKKNKLLNLPIIRGPIILAETMVMGIKALNYSANVSIEEEGEDEKLSTGSLLVTLFISLGLAIFLFKLLPLFIAESASTYISFIANKYFFNLTEGITKIIILIGYIYFISLMPDVRRVFQYHGAEHKVVNAYEHKDLENPKKYSRIHVRCGTSFILFVLALSILVYLFIPLDYNFAIKLLIRLALLPLIAGIAYELIKISGKYDKKLWFKIIISPGLFLQKLTTKEPNEKQLEVAMTALKSVI
ncbi:DUF1385 domain-containing protein [archaeon]|jgi:uncharacterized protein YqhQ|nr:DUF1385 domain-containing protein [archaeon]MBT4669695.1 DUF1385 domain-containing protein [archaeon]MBT5030448.1 DUF1385 domain-containing protein [archaeon]MBT5288259.1 DUF1385 domain-containing protein [archaeon]MBT7052897.1 DUF1385 domain-containing protein [archaeon]